ncbi:MAG: hypothetical protein HY650_10935 [Acidobacteria bacterium]|nr:hypothetical protein [Acidobacteriota bacterium]
MKASHTAVIKEEIGWWIDWIGEVPGIIYQEKTRQERIAAFRGTLPAPRLETP